MLKQTALFDKLKKKNLTVSKYYILYQLYGRKDMLCVNRDVIKHHHKDLLIYMNKDYTLNEKGNKLIKEVEMIFKPLKKLKNINLLGVDYTERIKEFITIFPTQKLPSGKYPRGNAKNIEENFMWFFQEYPDYEWNTILEATEKYVEEYRLKNYEYMRTAMYFIKKLKDGTSESELANYCDIALNSDDYIPQRQIKSRVV